MPTPVRNTDVNRSIDSIARGAPEAAKSSESAKIFAAFGARIQALFASIGSVASQIGSNRPAAPSLGSPAAPTQQGHTGQAEKSKEAQGTTVTVKDPKEEALKKLRAAGHEVKDSEMSDDLAERLASNETLSAEGFKEIERNRVAMAEKEKNQKNVAATTVDKEIDKVIEDGLAEYDAIRRPSAAAEEALKSLG